MIPEDEDACFNKDVEHINNDLSIFGRILNFTKKKILNAYNKLISVIGKYFGAMFFLIFIVFELISKHIHTK